MAKVAQAREQASEPDGFGNQDEITLGVLTAIERDGNMSQRVLSRELGVALGLANAYLKRCVRKGWIKIQQVPPRRYAYYLTPQGFSAKARLTSDYLSSSFTFFRRAREQMAELMTACVAKSWKRIAFAGTSELAEVGVLCVQDHDVELAGVIDPEKSGELFLGVPVVGSVDELGEVDAVVVTDLANSADVFKALKADMGRGRVLAPPLLRLNERAGKGRK